MKKLLILFSLFIPFLVNAQDSVYLYGSTTNSKNKVIARNDFQVNGTFYLGSRDTTFTPSKAGAIVTRPQDSKPYIYEGGIWNVLNYGFYNIFPKNLLHPSNDSTFRLGGIADTITYMNFSNNFRLVLDSLTSGVNSGLQINLGGDAKWDLFERDSASGNLIPIHIGSSGQVLTVLTSGGLGYTAPPGSTDLGKSATSNSITITSSTGQSAVVPSATHILAGPISGPSQARLDSTITFHNPEDLAGDSLIRASVTLDSVIFRKILIRGGPGITVKDSSVLDQILKNLSVDTSVVIPKLSVANRVWGNPTGSTASSIGVGLASPLGFSGGNIAITGVGTVPMGSTGNGTYTINELLLSGTTATGAFQQVAYGTSGQVLTSNGTGVAPTMQNAVTGFTSPMTTLGDIIYQGPAGPTRLAGNTSATRQLYSSLGTGAISAAPTLFIPGASDVMQWLAFTPENITNKSIVTTLGASNTLYPSQNAVKTYVDAQAAATLTLTNKSISGASNSISNIGETSFTFGDVVTANASITAHGLSPKLPNSATLFYNGVGGFTSPIGTNIYNLDGTVSSALRTITLGGNTVKFTGGPINFNSTSITTNGSVNYLGSTPGLLLNNSIVDNGFTGSGGTRALIAQEEIGQSSISATNTNVTFTNGASLYIDGAPSASTNVTITNPYALYVAGGNSFFGGGVTISKTGNFPFTIQSSTQSSINLVANSGGVGSGFTILRSVNGDDAQDFAIYDQIVGLSRFGINSLGKVTIPGTLQIQGGSPALNKVLTSDASGNGSWGLVLTSGTYSPTLTNVTNTSTLAVSSATYKQVGNIVDVQISGTLSITASTSSSFSFTLPIATTMTSGIIIGDGGCTVASGSLDFLHGAVIVGSSTTGAIQLNTINTGSQKFTVRFQYSL